MTRASLTARNGYTGTGSVDTYSYGFIIESSAHLLVTEELISTGVTTTLALTTNYTVTGVGAAAGGTIVLVAGNLPSTKKLSIRRVVPLTQVTDIRNQGDFFPEVHEDEFDKRNDVAQQQGDEIDRSLKISETVDPSAFNMEISGLRIAGAAPIINAAADGMEWVDLDAAAIAVAVAATAADAISTAADVVSTNADVVTTNADVVLTAADVVSADASAVAAAASAASLGASIVNHVSWSCQNNTQVIIDSGTVFTGVDSEVQFTFTTNRTFDPTGTAGALGALNTGTEASNTWYYLIALGDTTSAVTPHIIGVTAALYASFTTASLTGDYAVYDDYKRIGAIRNNAGGHFNWGWQFEGVFYFDTAVNAGSTTSTTYVDLDLSAFMPPVSRVFTTPFLQSSTGVAYWKTKGGTHGGFQLSQGLSTSMINATVYSDASQVVQYKVSTGTVTAQLAISFQDNLIEEGQ